MAASRFRPRNAMKNILLVVAWYDLASLVTINLRRHRFLRYDVPRPRYACCHLFAASQGLPLSKLIVARAIPIASWAFATVAIRRSIGGAAVVATAIVIDTTTTMALISAVDNVVASIVAKSNLAAFFFTQFFDPHRILQYDVKKYARRSRFLQYHI